MSNPEIKNRFTGAIIIEAGKYASIKEAVERNSADLRSADLSSADLSFADLSFANLRFADLSFADLRSANLSYADLRYANLRSADLSSANLSSAENLLPEYLLPNLYILKLMPSKTVLTAWKYIINGKSPYQYSVYEVGKTYKEKDYCTDEQELCGKGLNVATLQWCLRDNRKEDIELLEVEFKVSDIIAIPYATNGKFRVRRMKVLRKITRKQAEKLLKDAMKAETKGASE